ncbi:GntR family transcriptional regulator [Staphylococcus gallinarum]|uniref:GntR family transcriptional regulator n=1 Tax=Staphylococcus gallinarum TaxID=1293 RepID=A0A380FKV1_STAGA|nr:GntR family transcriptional regulator [Staphylococcus gallinarum]
MHIDGKVLCYEQSYFNKDIVLYLDTSIAEGSIFRYLEQRIKVKIGFSDIYFTVDKLNSEGSTAIKFING